MRTHITNLGILFLLVMAACGTGISAPTATQLPTFTPKPPPYVEALCQKINIEPTPDAKDTSLFPAVSDADHVVGPKDAAMTIIEYGDFQ
jgi:hypothetical protein